MLPICVGRQLNGPVTPQSNIVLTKINAGCPAIRSHAKLIPSLARQWGGDRMPSYVRGRERGRLLDDTEIVEAYLSGETADSIAQRAACCGVTVLQIIRRAGVAVRKPGAKPAHKPRRISDGELVRMYRDGKSGPLIADLAGCTPGTVYRVLRSLGVPVRPSPSRTGGRKKARADG